MESREKGEKRTVYVVYGQLSISISLSFTAIISTIIIIDTDIIERVPEDTDRSFFRASIIADLPARCVHDNQLANDRQPE